VQSALLVELLFEDGEKSVIISGPYYRPRNDLQLPRMKACDEVIVTLILNNLLQFESKPLRNLSFVPVDDVLDNDYKC
jgi:hypothetical protein